jgi:transposase-like protein
MLDGEHLNGCCVVVALAIGADGAKLPVGLWDGSIENKTVVRSLLADLVERPVRRRRAAGRHRRREALAAAVRDVLGAKAAIQRCTLHKRRNIADHLPDKEKAFIDAKLVKAVGHPDPDLGLRNPRGWPPAWNAATPVPPRRCAMDSTGCSPSPGSATTAASPRPWPPRTRPSR